MNKKILFNFILVLVWLIVIYVFSATPSIESNNGSLNIIKDSIKNTTNITNKIGITNTNYDDEELTKIAKNYNYIFRKFIHFSEYFILTLLFYLVIKQVMDYNIYLCSILLCFITATWDEIHQIFTPGRSALFGDILIDTCGGIMTALVLMLIHRIRRRRRIIEK